MRAKHARLAAICLFSATIIGCKTIDQEPSLNNLASSDSTIPQDHQPSEESLADSGAPADTEATIAETDLWQRIIDGYQLNGEGLDHPRVKSHLNWFKKHPEYIDRVTKRGEPYLFHIVESLDKAGLPLELALLPIVESAFDPFAYSHGSASGIWQFIASTGNEYGLEQNWWYDGRRDIYASTDAAVAYLSRLHRRFNHDWHLALAAYNSGQGTVSRSMRRNVKAGKDTDFFSLKLPKETSAYVPKLIALAEVVRTPEKYGATLNPIANVAVITQVDTQGQLDLTQAAKLAEIPVDTIYKLNPGFSQWATDPNGPHKIVVPVDKVDSFTAALNELPKSERVKWVRYSVKPGDTLSEIASKHNTTQKVITSINNLNGSFIRVNQALMIPTAQSGDHQYTFAASNRAENKASKRSTTTHIVKSGDSFWSLSRKHGVTTRQLAALNSMAPKDTLRVGQTIYIPSNNPSRSTKVKRVHYKVRSGDSLSRIASKFGVTANDIVKWNNLDKKSYLQPGQALKVFVTVTGA